MEKDEARLEELTRSRRFEELTPDERFFVLEKLGSEEAFHAMKRAEGGMMAGKLAGSPSPDPKHLPLLKARLREQMQPQSAGWFGFKVPAYAAVILMVVTAMVTWMLTPERTLSTPPSSTVIQTVDTVYVVRVDTVFREKKLLRYVASMQPCVEKKTTVSLERDAATPVGVSMKDKEELDKLLVSGSDR